MGTLGKDFSAPEEELPLLKRVVRTSWVGEVRGHRSKGISSYLSTQCAFLSTGSSGKKLSSLLRFSFHQRHGQVIEGPHLSMTPSDRGRKGTQPTSLWKSWFLLAQAVKNLFIRSSHTKFIHLLASLLHGLFFKKSLLNLL